MEKKIFGTLADGRVAHIYTLSGDRGVQVQITDFGGIIVSMLTPDRDGRLGEIGIGFATLAQYEQINGYFGALIGRVGNRIANGRFSLDGKQYQLYTSASGEHLHGGQYGFNAKLWNSDIDGDKLRLQYLSPDGDEKYPGDLDVTVWYSLTGMDLSIEYQATCDRPTIVNMTNHAYFNLNCYQSDVLDHELRLQADKYNPVNQQLIPTGEFRPVKGTAYDFTTAKPIGRDIAEAPGGYDNNFVFNKTGQDGQEWLAEAYDPQTGRTLAMATTEPCVQFYSGNFLDGTLTGHNNTTYKKHYGFCLEAQKPPDAINQKDFPSIVLRPGETYRQTTVYRFGSR